MAVYTDNFNRTENPLGNPWTIHPDWNNLQANGTQCLGTASTSSMYYNDTFADDQYSEGIVPTKAADNSEGFLCRINTTSGACYETEIFGTNDLSLYYYNGGSFSEIDSAVYALGAAEVLTLECNGTTIRTLVDDVEKNSVTNASLASGPAGVLTFNTTGRIDDWEGGDLGAPPAGIEIFRRRIEGY